jgi:hypothetical protein
MNMKKKLLLVAIALTFVLTSCGEATTELRTLATLRRIDDFPLYEMHYYGDYDFESFLQEGLRTDKRSQPYEEETDNSWACTCFSSLNQDGELVFGRNFDWHSHPALVLFTSPPGGYASVSMVDISYLGYDEEMPSWIERRELLRAPYLPFDGMNEYGLAVGIMAVPYADGGNDPEKVTIGGLQAVRLMLDYAKDVEEALSLLEDYNIDFQGGPPLHYLISDSSGNSAVTEFINGEIKVIRKSERWQVSTNFLISNVRPEGARSPCWRYNRAYETLEQADGNISREKAMALLEHVSQSVTIWSAVYNMTTGDIRVVMGREYDEVHEFTLGMRDD